MGDVQWMTAGAGLQHCEMFPLRNKDKGNRLELFQIWLNLPKKDKFTDPHFKMLWDHQIPKLKVVDDNGLETTVKVFAGNYNGSGAPAPAPASWAASPEHGVQIWTVHIPEGGLWELPSDLPEMQRMLYFYRGGKIRIAGMEVSPDKAIELLADQPVIIEAAAGDTFLLFMQALPINEPLVQHGPFAMNTTEEIRQAIADYRSTQFGGWPWDRYDHVHPRDQERFARYADGRVETP